SFERGDRSRLDGRCGSRRTDAVRRNADGKAARSEVGYAGCVHQPCAPANERKSALVSAYQLLEASDEGIVNWNTAPPGSFWLAPNRPPCASMIDRQIDSPIPRPPDFVE